MKFMDKIRDAARYFSEVIFGPEDDGVDLLEGRVTDSELEKQLKEDSRRQKSDEELRIQLEWKVKNWDRFEVRGVKIELPYAGEHIADILEHFSLYTAQEADYLFRKALPLLDDSSFRKRYWEYFQYLSQNRYCSERLGIDYTDAPAHDWRKADLCALYLAKKNTSDIL